VIEINACKYMRIRLTAASSSSPTTDPILLNPMGNFLLAARSDAKCPCEVKKVD